MKVFAILFSVLICSQFLSVRAFADKPGPTTLTPVINQCAALELPFSGPNEDVVTCDY